MVVKHASLEAHPSIREGLPSREASGADHAAAVHETPVHKPPVLEAPAPPAQHPVAQHHAAQHHAKVRPRSRLATKGEAIPALGYDLHDPNFPFGRATVVSVPDLDEGGTGAHLDMVLPTTVAPVIDKLVAALAERDQRIRDLEERIAGYERMASREAPATDDATLAPAPAPAEATQDAPAPVPKGKRRRLTGLFRVALHGPEIGAVLEALEDERLRLDSSELEHHRRALAGLDALFREMAAAIIAARPTIQIRLRQDSEHPRTIFLSMACALVVEKLKSGFVHDAPGLLSPVGLQLLYFWQYGQQALIDTRHLGAAEVGEARRALEREIALAG